jgi:hypothetical protein
LFLGLGVASAPHVAVAGLVVAVLAGRYLRAGFGFGTAVAGTALGSWLLIRVILLPGAVGELDAAWKGWAQSVPGYGSIWLGPQLLGASKPDPANSLGGRALQGLFGWLFNVGSLSGTSASVLSVLLLAVLVVVILQLTLVADATVQRIDEPSFNEFAFGDSSTGDLLDNGVRTGQATVIGPPMQLTPARFVTDKVAPLSLALLAALLFSAKSLPVQASLLLLPLIALSGLRWRDHLIWAATELVYFVGIWLYIGGETTPNRGLPAVFYMFLLAARLAGIAWIGVQGVLVYRSPQDAPVDADPFVDKPAIGRPAVDRFLSS